MKDTLDVRRCPAAGCVAGLPGFCGRGWQTAQEQAACLAGLFTKPPGQPLLKAPPLLTSLAFRFTSWPMQLVKLESDERLALGAGKPYERHLP